ncbi:MAG: GTP-binding protein, partial [Candidatus Altiarchaeales archaeon]|nr:GTP-binding protein [Candidatus Altiarchaeales archaeon]
MIVVRDNIGIFGKVNSGKSSLMNLLTQQECSITDPTPGTTADTKTTMCEIHGLGPVKLFDTPGMDEAGELGLKKRRKAENDLKECDLVLLVVDPNTSNFETENHLIHKAREYGKQLFIVYNIFQDDYNLGYVGSKLDYSKFYKKIQLKAVNPDDRPRLLNFIIENFESKNARIELLPFVRRDEYYLLHIPMDEETPPGRYLRPQAMAEEYITRNFAFPISCRTDLKSARGSGFEAEKKRYLSVLEGLKDKKVKCVLTDSQAIDVIDAWTPKG